MCRTAKRVAGSVNLMPALSFSLFRRDLSLMNPLQSYVVFTGWIFKYHPELRARTKPKACVSPQWTSPCCLSILTSVSFLHQSAPYTNVGIITRLSISSPPFSRRLHALINLNSLRPPSLFPGRRLVISRDGRSIYVHVVASC